MHLNEGKNNELWAFQIIDHLVNLGVTYFCIAPGSRSGSLTLAAASHPKVETFVHFDERGLAFHALGYGKASLKAAAIIVTSGTAVGNLLPAIMEASIAHIPIIILTADRPPELRDCGANQTADHVKLFGNYVRWQVDVPCPDDNLPESYLSSLLSYAVFKGCETPFGPVHINCMFREPLYSANLAFPSEGINRTVRYAPSIATCSEKMLQMLAEKLSSYSSGMIIVGSLSNPEDAKAIVALGKAMNWPVVSDITSHMRPHSYESPCICYFDAIIKNAENMEVDCVLHLGDRIVSKTVSEWLSHQEPDYYLVADHSDRYDPKGQIDFRLHCDISWFCTQIIPHLNVKESQLLSLWLEYSDQIKNKLHYMLTLPKDVSEPGIIHMISSTLPKDWNVFLSNSMPVRDADSFFYPENFAGKVFVNRGVSGIDGNVSTAAGIAAAMQQPLVAVLGDLAFMHDMNAIVQIAKSPVPVVLLVINNGGGGIFSFLPIHSKTAKFEEYFAIAHDYHFEKLAQFAGLEFYKPGSMQELAQTWQNLKATPRSCFIEVVTNREENVTIHKQIHQTLKECLCSPLEPTAR